MLTVHLRRGVAALAMALTLTWPVLVAAQTNPVFDATGFQNNRDYLSELPFEHVDMLTGSLVLTFSDVAFPGNAGGELRIQRTFNSKTNRWLIGVAGHPGVTYAPDPQNQNVVILTTTDGAEHRALPYRFDLQSPERERFLMTEQFWIFDKTARVLYFPDGTVNTYTTAGVLIESRDPFGNKTTFTDESPSRRRVTQNLTPWENRELTLDYNLKADGTRSTLSQMQCNGRTWTYSWIDDALTTVTPPIGPGWSYNVNGSPSQSIYTMRVTTPHGGTVDYTLQRVSFTFTSGTGPSTITSPALTRRVVGGAGAPAGNTAWTYQYSFFQSTQTSARTIVGTPTGNAIVYDYREVLTPFWQDDTRYALAERTVLEGGLTVVEIERRDYTAVPHTTSSSALLINGANATSSELQRRTVQRGGSFTYSTEYHYALQNYGDYHRPYEIVETGTDTRTTTRTYDYFAQGGSFGSGPLWVAVGNPLIMGQLASERTAVGGESFLTSWTYDPQGFMTSQNQFGITSSFGRDSQGNRSSLTRPNSTSESYVYQWGVLRDVTTGEYSVTRTINADGTVASETKGGRTTTFSYDALARVTLTNLPGGTNAIVTTYDNVVGRTVAVSRGSGSSSSSITTTLDGFGRPTQTVDSASVKRETRYDAEGRVVYESLPYVTLNVGVTTQFDALGRVTRLTRADGKYVQFQYGINVVTITDENGHQRSQRLQIFGDPDKTRISQIQDDTGLWTYSYNATGKLTKVQTSDSQRTWLYDSRNLLSSETNPESGSILYTYDAAGFLKTKQDAKGNLLTYTLDRNNRIILTEGSGVFERTRYEPNTDNIAFVENDNVSTTSDYDTAGRLWHRNTQITESKGPNLSVTQAPSTALQGGGNVNAGAHSYAISYVTADGETLAGPTVSIVAAAGDPIQPPVLNGMHGDGVTSVNTGSGPVSGRLTPSSYYSYKVTYYTAAGETLPSVSTAPYCSSYCTVMNVYLIPTSSDPAVVGRRLYRGPAGSFTGPYGLVATIANKQSTSFFDFLSDGERGGAPPTTNTAGPSTPQQTVVLSNIPTGPLGVVSRKIYRTAANGTALRLLATIPNNTATTYTDVAGDSALGAYAAKPGGITYTLEFGYDNNDELTKITYPTGRQVSVTRAEEGRVTRVFDISANRDYATNVQYHPSGAVSSFIAGNGIAHTMTFDPNRYWPTGVASGSFVEGYAHDFVGNVTATTDSRPNMAQTLSYDAVDRLISATGAYGTATYAYDQHGNRLDWGGATYRYDADTLRLREQNGQALTYDPNGNLETGFGVRYTYNANDEMRTATVGTTTLTYGYSPGSWRVSKSSNNAQTTYFLRGPSGEVLTELTGNDYRDYIYLGDRLIAAVKRQVP